ncbi:transglycosylase [Pseudoroseomonas wenyumeiae]|uniref:Transglycosylase n=2 Tax=Teichococcus wenyumeiae TaxID=2478470 RepID=A0A3A9JH79_9PROT|nr:transglycosylase SLT domain-containing protein [Pseudoroseomonas wenyumeiae]RKK05730.1 transglycosylase [Pseudoroseomonas wenyumeiae]RMI26179.1 transglycosylase [Pseudoroseomonas wenyumeiae]
MSRPAEAAGPRSACLDAARAAEAAYDLPDGLLVAVALAESGLHAHALNIGGRSYYPETAGEAARLLDGAGARQSVMAGCVQVNARVHDRRGSNWPLDPRKATVWAAKHLRMQYDRLGNWADAIRAWNGAAPGSSNKLVCRVEAKLEVVVPGENVLGRTGCGRGEIAWVRRSGVQLLELAEAPNN